MKLEDISRREEISPSFLVQILNELKRAGLVTSKRGKAGGYLLSRAPGSITVSDTPTEAPVPSAEAVASMSE